MPKNLREILSGVVKTIAVTMKGESFKAVKYISPTLVVRAVRKRYNKKIIKDGNIEITLTIGKPNYLEREFISDCRKSGEPFSVKKIQVKEYNPRNINLRTRKHEK